MGNRLGAGARAVEIRAEIGAENAQGGSGCAFGGDVDMLSGEGRGGGVENWKGRHPGFELGGYGGVEFNHCKSRWNGKVGMRNGDWEQVAIEQMW